MKKLSLLVLTFALLTGGIASAGILPLKDGDAAMIEHSEQPGNYKEVHVLYIENGMARVRAEIGSSSNLIREHMLATVPVESLVHPVDSMGEFKLGDKVCLNKSIKTFRKGFCSKVHRMYENGRVELWNGYFTSNVLVDLKDIQHRQ